MIRKSGFARALTVLVGAAWLWWLPTQAMAAAPMADYCVSPPYIGGSIEPNLLLLIDNSASMYDLQWTDTTNKYCANDATLSCTTDATCATAGTAYCFSSTKKKDCSSDLDCDAGDSCLNLGAGVKRCNATFVPITCTNDATCSAITSGDTCNNKCTATHACLDDTYINAGSYAGYFDQNATYSYDSASGKFVSGATLPGSCSYSAGSPAYVCINVGATGITSFVASGKFLNWLTASKFDIEKQILTGGKYDAANGVLVGESRGCSGRKFIKTIPTMSDVTFAIRGGSLSGTARITNQSTEYGQTYIEIYKGAYNAAACAAAMNDWMNVSSTFLGTLQVHTSCCLEGGTKLSGCNPSGAELIAANQVIHDCFWYFNGHGLSNLQPLKNTCLKDSWPITPPDMIIDPDAGNAVCSSMLSHPDYFGTGDVQGYLGLCYSGTWDDTCVLRENKAYCEGLGGTAAVTDPDSSTVAPGMVKNVPGFVMEHGLDSLTYLGDLIVKVALATPPTGLIDNFKQQIRFGAMNFQNDGSATECDKIGGYCSLDPLTSCSADSTCIVASKGSCVFPVSCAKNCSVTTTRMCYINSDCPSGETCISRTATDGGKFPSSRSYVGAGFCSSTIATACQVDSDCPGGEICRADIGTHSAGLVFDIDEMPATSWTPYAEMFYNAMGYFARTNDYTASPPTSRNFNFTGLPASYVTDKNPSQALCQKNNILMITDGMSTADRNAKASGTTGLAGLYASEVGGTYSGVYGYDFANKCPDYQGSRSLPVLSWVAKNRDIKTLSTSSTSTIVPVNSSAYITTYVVYTGPGAGSKPGLCDPYRLMDNTAANGGTTLYSATTPSALYNSLKAALEKVAAVAASGTAASVLASGEGSGANLVQAVFYPRRLFKNGASNDEVAWTGRLSNLWYYVDPFYNNSTIREDDGDKILNLKTDATHADYITSLYYDKDLGTTYAARFEDTLGTGAIGTQLTPDVIFENVKNLWEAGTLLWKRDVTTASGKRKLYTSSFTGTTSVTINSTMYTGVTHTLLTGNFSSNNVNPTSSGGTPDADNRAFLRPYLQAASDTEAANIIDWVQGIDKKVCSNDMSTICTSSADCTSPGTCGYLYRPRTVKIESIDSTARVWKLGDVVNSTPRISSWTALNDYHKRYADATYGIPYADAVLGEPADDTHFVTTQAYKDRGMVYAGSNDGMLHAFKVGTLQLKWSGQGPTEKAKLVNKDTHATCGTGDTEPCGKEMWAFIPKQALPYLRYMADPAYCHVYSVDLTPFVFDASIGGAADDMRTADSWRTVLIGGMRFGGACRKQGTCAAGGDCVNTPLIDPDDNTKGLGYSTYFALDVTDPVNPQLLWEFSHDELGFSTTGPAIVRINGTTGGSSNVGTNGNWFVIFGSGPTGPITPERQFLGHSDQNLKLFILDLRTGTLMRKMESEMSIANAFAGSLNNGAVDVHEPGNRLQNYQDDVVYVPYVKKASAGTAWTDGGVGRLVTNQDPDPAAWEWSTVIDNVGPVTAAVSKLEDTTNGNLWLYFGTGRYYYVQGSSIDDPTGQRYLVGLKDPCYNSSGFDPTCTAGVLPGSLRDVTNVSDVPPVDEANGTLLKGWYIQLDPAGQYTYSPAANYMAERVITDSLATGQGTVFFTSYKPYTDLCNFGGKTFIWGVNYNTGGVPLNLKGKVLIQVSTGAIEQKDLSSAFTAAGGRKTAAMEGKPPEAQGMSIIGAPGPTKKVVHIKER